MHMCVLFVFSWTFFTRVSEKRKEKGKEKEEGKGEKRSTLFETRLDDRRIIVINKPRRRKNFPTIDNDKIDAWRKKEKEKKKRKEK